MGRKSKNPKHIRVYTGGTFDLLHIGHIDLLRKAKEIGNYLIVSLNTDEFVKEYKKKPPVQTYEERKEMLEACRYVDEVIPNTGGYDSKPSILKAKPQYIIHGTDWMGDSYLKQLDISVEFLTENNIGLIYVPRVKRSSTTDVKARVTSHAKKYV
jgi:glycerol-3-phosphate cytidylyltransferase